MRSTRAASGIRRMSGATPRPCSSQRAGGPSTALVEISVATRRQWICFAVCMAVVVTGCTAPGSKDPFVGFGPDPSLPAPQSSLIPQVGVPDVVGWPAGAAPKAPPGFTVTRYAEGLEHPRWLLALPNGDVLVAEAAAPRSHGDRTNTGIRAWFQKMLPWLDPDALLIDLWLDEPCQISQRFLPAEITSLRRNGVRHACLHDIQRGADRYFLQCHSHLHLAGQVGIVELVRVAQPFTRDEVDILAAKHVAFAGREIAEGHFECTADFCFQMVHRAGKAVGRQPFRQRVRFEERAIDFFRAGCQNPVQAYRIGHADLLHELPVHTPRTKHCWPARHGISVNLLKRREREIPAWTGRNASVSCS